MPIVPVNRVQMRKETGRLDRSSNISEGEALDATMRRAGTGDYRVAIDDRATIAAVDAVKVAVDQTKNMVQSEGNESQVLLSSIKTAVDQTKSMVQSESNEAQVLLTDIKNLLTTAVSSLETIKTNSGISATNLSALLDRISEPEPQV